MKYTKLFLAALVMLLGYSCSIQEPDNGLIADDYSAEFLSFKASFGDFPATKTVFVSSDASSWPINWTQGDAINIFYGSRSEARFETADGGPVAEFEGYLKAATGAADENGNITTQNFWGLYPYNENNTCNGSSVTLTIPSAQTGVAGTFANGLNPSVACSPNMGLTFYNVGSWFIFTLTQENVVSATLTGANGETLVGKVKVSMDENSRPKVDEVTEGSTTVTMTPEGGSFQVGEYYCMVILPGTFNDGVVLTLTKGDGTRAECAVKRTDGNPMVIERSKWARKKNADDGLVYKQVPQLDGHEYVDMGNGVMWATMNIGATSVTDPGDLLSWSDGKAAAAAWGENWRMPTKEEIQSLIDNCTWTWDKNKNGMIVTSTNGNSIFLPVAGYIDDEHPSGFGTDYLGDYWSSAPDYYFEVEEENEPMVCNGGGYVVLMSIRPVVDMVYAITTPTGEMGGHAYVNMGNGLMWATMNVGATSVTDPGNLLSWSDGKTAATAWGENWRMPTKEEIQSLIDNCTWTWDKNKNGMIVTSTNGNSIFLPVAGYIDDEHPSGFGTDYLGDYWSSAPDYYMEIEEEWEPMIGNGGGSDVLMSVRPVIDRIPPSGVDMGNDLLWATFNVGSNSPEYYGNYYSWGEIEIKNNYDWDYYKFGYTPITKYNKTDKLTVLEASDDVATSEWGGSWRIPTAEDWQWLKEHCRWAETSNYNGTGVAGYTVTATNGNSIFLPFAGYFSGNPEIGISDYGNAGLYWSSTLYYDPVDVVNARMLVFYSGGDDVYVSNSIRCEGLTIRPVTPK